MDINVDKYKQKNIFLQSLANRMDGNIFASNSKTNDENQRKEQPQSNSTRINDYDSNILENNAYQTLPDEMLKIEHRLGILESSLSKINNEIEALESFGDNVQVGELKHRKQLIEKELIEQNKKYSELSFGAKLSGQIASAVRFTSGKKTSTLSKVKNFVKKKILAKISKKFNYSENMKEALDKLSNINSNVDELVTMKIPYGEKSRRYANLTAYLNRANVIQSNISRNFKEMK